MKIILVFCLSLISYGFLYAGAFPLPLPKTFRGQMDTREGMSYIDRLIPFDANLVDSYFTPDWVGPNELNPQDLKHIFENNPISGAYLAVGTERAFTAAALWENCEALILVDVDPNSVLYNVINQALLIISNNRQHYVNLRFEKEINEIAQALEHSLIDKDMKELVLLNWHWWIFCQEKHMGNRLFTAPLFGQLPKDSIIFKDANYLLDDKLFEKIQRLAQSDNIVIIEADINKKEELTLVKKFCNEKNVKISYIDTSNCLAEMYHEESFLTVLKDFEESIAHEKCQFISTFWPTSCYFASRKNPLEPSERWQYVNYRYIDIKIFMSKSIFWWHGYFNNLRIKNYCDDCFNDFSMQKICIE